MDVFFLTTRSSLIATIFGLMFFPNFIIAAPKGHDLHKIVFLKYILPL